MFSIEHDFDSTVITLVDDGARAMSEDITVCAFEDCVTVEQYDPRREDVIRITFTMDQVRDLAAALNLPRGLSGAPGQDPRLTAATQPASDPGSGEAERLVPASGAADQFKAGLGDAQMLRQQDADRLVRLAVLGRTGDADLEPGAVPGDLRARGVGRYPDLEDLPGRGRVAGLSHARRPPKGRPNGPETGRMA